MGTLVFQAWDEDDLNGTPIGTLADPSEKAVLLQHNGVGAGEFNLSRHSDERQDCRPGRYITVHLDSVSNDPFFGFFVTESQNVVLSENEQGAEVFHRSGEGPMSVLADAIVWYESVTNNDAAEPTDDAYWHWTAAMNAHPAGIMVRMLEEAQERGAFPFLTYDFTRDEDSNSDPWTVDLEDFQLAVGTDLLSVAGLLQQLGLVFVMDPDFVLHCYEADSYGSDVSGSVVFTAGDNIATAASQAQLASQARSSVLVKGKRGDNGEVAWVEADSAAGLAELKRRKEGFLDAGETTGFDALQLMGLESIYQKLRIKAGPTYIGVYDTGIAPFTDYNLGDTAEVDVPGVWENEDKVITSIGFTDTEAGEYDIVVGFEQGPVYQGKASVDAGSLPQPCNDCPPEGPFVPDPDCGEPPGVRQHRSTDTGDMGSGGGVFVFHLDSVPETGNLIVAILTTRGAIPSDQTDWTSIATTTSSSAGQRMFSRVAGSWSSTGTFNFTIGGACRVTVFELDPAVVLDVAAADDHSPNDDPAISTTGLTVDGDRVLIGSVVVDGPGVAGGASVPIFSLDAPFTQVDYGQMTGSQSPTHATGYRSVSGAGTYDMDVSLTVGGFTVNSDVWTLIAAFRATGAAQDCGPNAGDTTSEEITGDGATDDFTLNYPYFPGSLLVTVDGVRIWPDETDPEAGTFSLPAAPSTGAQIIITYQVASPTPTGEANPQPTPTAVSPWPEELDDLDDVNAPTPNDGDVLTWDSTPGEWVPQAPVVVAELDDLDDVVITAAAVGDRLRFDGTDWVDSTLHWEPLVDGTGQVLLDGLGNILRQEVAY